MQKKSKKSEIVIDVRGKLLYNAPAFTSLVDVPESMLL